MISAGAMKSGDVRVTGAALVLSALYGIYEEDIWYDYDKANAPNFKENK